jgi:hypothetical protein
MVISPPFRKKHDHHPTHLSWHGSPFPGCLHQSYKQPPAVPCPLHTIRRLFTLYATELLFQLFRLHPRHTSCVTVP